MPITYKDKTFCINVNCKKECRDKLTPEIIEAAKKWAGNDNPPIAMADFDCGKESEE